MSGGSPHAGALVPGSREHIWKLKSGIGHRQADTSRRPIKRCIQRYNGMADRMDREPWVGGNGERLMRFSGE